MIDVSGRVAKAHVVKDPPRRDTCSSRFVLCAFVASVSCASRKLEHAHRTLPPRTAGCVMPWAICDSGLVNRRTYMMKATIHAKADQAVHGQHRAYHTHRHIAESYPTKLMMGIIMPREKLGLPGALIELFIHLIKGIDHLRFARCRRWITFVAGIDLLNMAVDACPATPDAPESISASCP